MSTTKENTTKLIEASEKRDEAKVYLSKYFLANQDSVSQNLLRSWKNFEQLEEEVKAEEAEEFKRLELEIAEQQKIEGEDAKLVQLLKRRMRCIAVLLIAHLLYPHLQLKAEDCSAIGLLILDRMKENKLDLTAMAEKVGVSRAALRIACLKQGSPGKRTISKLAINFCTV